MANTLQDYLNNRGVVNPSNPDDVALAALAQNVVKYSKNKNVLESLGVKDPSNPVMGFLQMIAKPLSVPGNLVRAGIEEAIGQPNAQLRQVSGLDELKGLLSGNIQTGAGDLPFLKTRPGDSNITRFAKLGGAFAGDVLSDPLSYVGAPAAISRKAAGNILVSHITDPANDILKRIELSSNRGSEVIDKLAAAAPQSRVGEIQNSLKMTVDAGTPADVLNTLTKDELAKETLANYLLEGLQTGGRKKVINRLEEMTGDRASAIEIYKTLPEDVKGGIVLTSPLGYPIKSAGENIRLTQGTGQLLGPVGEALNKVRFGASTVFPAKQVGKYFSGTAGQLYDAAKVGMAKEVFPEVNKIRGRVLGIEQEVPEVLPEFAVPLSRPRMIDYINAKDVSNKQGQFRRKLNGRSLAAVSEVAHLESKYTAPEDLEKFKEVYSNVFFAPEEVQDVTNPIVKDAVYAAGRLRKQIIELYKDAKANGVEIGLIGTPETWAPLIMTEDSFKQWAKTEAGRMHSDGYNTIMNRDSNIRVYDSPEAAAKFGVPLTPDNPNIVMLDARKANEQMILENDPRRFVADPTQAFQMYSNLMVNKIATKRFLNDITKYGIGFSIIPMVQKMINEKTSANLISVAQNTSPGIVAAAKERVRVIDEKLAKLIDGKKLEEVQTKIKDIRELAERNFADARAQEKITIANLDAAQEKVDTLYPTNAKAIDILRTYSTLSTNYNREVAIKERIARSLRAKVARAEGKPEIQLLNEILDDLSTAATPEDALIYQRLIQDLDANPDSVVNKLKGLSMDKERAVEELTAARIMRDRVDKGMPEIMKNDVLDYATAVEQRNAALAYRESARTLRQKANREVQKNTTEMAIEGKDTIDYLTTGYFDALNAAKQFSYNSKLELQRISQSGATLAEVDAFKLANKVELKRLADLAEKERISLRDVLNMTSPRMQSLARDYAKQLVLAMENLSKESFETFKVISSANRINSYIDVYNTGLKSSDEVMQAMENLNVAYETMREHMPVETYNSLAESQKKFLNENNFIRIKTDIIDDKLRTSPLGKALATEGLQTVAATKATSDLFTNSGVKEWMDELYHIKNNPTAWEKQVNDYLDPLLQLWKQCVTISRGPGFLMTNVNGGLWNNYVGGITPRQMGIGFKAIFKMQTTFKKVAKEFPHKSLIEQQDIAMQRINADLVKIKVGDTNASVLLSNFLDMGGFTGSETEFAAQQIAKGGTKNIDAAFGTGKTQAKIFESEPTTLTGKVVQKGITFAQTNTLQRGLNDLNQTAELFMRFGAFVGGFEQYGTLKSAMDKTYLLHFNYQDLSNAEDWVRRIAPFYTWSRNNVPAQLRAVALQPGKIQKALYANQEFQNAYGADGQDAWMNEVLPEYMSTSDGFISKFKWGTGNLGFFSKMPYEDLNRMISVNDKGLPTVSTTGLAGSLGPFTTPIELLTGTNFQQGGAIQPSVEAPGYYRLLALGGLLPGSGLTTGEGGTTQVSGKMDLAVKSLLPLLPIAEKVANSVNFLTGNRAPELVQNAFTTKNRQNASLSDFLNTSGLAGALGLSVSLQTPKSLSGNIYGMTQKQVQAINNTTKRANIDLKFITGELAKGSTTAEINQKLLRGEGQVSDVNTKALSKKQLNNYYTALNSLNSPS